MNWITNLIVVLVLIILFVLFVIRLRYKLLKLWTEVSEKEVHFHKLLQETTILFYENRVLLQNEENAQIIRTLFKYRKKKLRLHLLKDRQDLFSNLYEIIDDVEDQDNEKLTLIRVKFEELQKCRRLYNSKILVYNQTISVFPTRFLAIKMNLQIKEYFG